MIEQLFVKDYILFEKAWIDFSSGMSVITGETGAGKSLLIDAIGYLMGKRIQSNIIREGKDKCILQMVLSLPDESIQKELEDNGFDIEEQLIIQRTFTKDQKSTIRINQQVTTLHFVRNLLSKLIDIHSQHDTYYLMDPMVQLDLLDCYAKSEDLLFQVKESYKAYSAAYKKYETTKNRKLTDDNLEELTNQLNEIESIWISQKEYDELENRIQQQANAQKTMETLFEASRLLHQDHGLLDSTYSLSKFLQDIDGFEEEADSIHDLYYSLQDLYEKIYERQEHLQEDARQLDQLQEQLYTLKKAMRKYGGSLSSMKERKEELLTQIDSIIHREDLLDRLEKDLKQKKNDYYILAQELSKKRCACFDSLSTSLEGHFKDLMLENARFKVDRKEKQASINGIDQIEFVVSMNPGQPFTPLKQSCSGGELSRLMLALKVVFHTEESTQTLIFDEIDTGVSGKVAFKMGEKMKMLSKNYQVLCITHLASVAAWANQHYCVIKTSKDNETFTQIKELGQEESIDELAIMASGTLSQASRDAAQDLKKRIQEACHG